MEKIGYTFKELMDKLRNWLIKILGGCAKKEFNTYRSTVYKNVKAMRLIEGLTDDEKLMLHEYRTDKLLRQGKAKINFNRRNL